MPVKSEQEFQTLNVQQLSLKTNLYGNILIPPFKGPKNETIFKTQSLERVDSSEIQKNGGHHKSLVSIDSQTSRKVNLTQPGFEQKGINRYDSGYGSGYGSYNEFVSETTFTESHETLVEEPDHLNEIIISEHNNNVIEEWPTYTIEYLSPEEDDVPHDLYSPSISPSNDSPGTSFTNSTPPVSPDQKPKRNEYIRLVERFGTDMKDTCLFPLALPMDGSDVYKGASTWESLNLLADCILFKWLEAAPNRKPINSVLPNASRYLFPNPDLESSIMQCPNIIQPLRRAKSELDLCKLGLTERTGLVNVYHRSKSSGVKDDIHINVSSEKGRSRALSSLTLRKNSVKYSVPKAKKDRFDLKVNRNMKTDAKALVQSIRLENPISLALQITKIEKELMTSLPSDEVMSLVINRGKRYDKNSGLKKLMEFGQELSQLIADIISREITVESQGKKIAAIIEVGCVLRKLRNWQSLSSLIRGLQLPQIYRLSNAWSVTKSKYTIHFNDYLRLCQVVRYDSIAILRSREPSIPSISSFISLLRIRCLATWDRLEMAPRWRQSPNLVNWLEKQMLNKIAIQESISNSDERYRTELEKKQKKKKQIISKIEAFQERRETHLEKCLKQLSPERASFMPLNDPIYFIEDDHLPNSWTRRSARNIPAVYQSKIVRCFNNSYKIETAFIKKYNTSS